MKFKTKIDSLDVLIETTPSPKYRPYRKEEAPNEELQHEILDQKIAYYKLTITINDSCFYNDGLLLATSESEHHEDLEEYIDQEEIIDKILEYLEIAD